MRAELKIKEMKENWRFLGKTRDKQENEENLLIFAER
jgi:hypothetical protein